MSWSLEMITIKSVEGCKTSEDNHHMHLRLIAEDGRLIELALPQADLYCLLRMEMLLREIRQETALAANPAPPIRRSSRTVLRHRGFLIRSRQPSATSF